MKKRLMACVGAVMLLSAVGFAKEPHFYQKGRLMSMDSVSCGYAEKSGKTITGEILGTDGGHKNTKEVLCQEYVLRTDQVLYRIRPRDDKHPILLPVGEVAEFRLYKDRVYLKISESDGKERDYTVVSMTPVENSISEKR
jgi:hypothetical protein